MLDSVLDLMLGSSCAACRRPGRALCRPCAESLPGSAAESWPSPVPAGLARPMSAGAYDGALKALVNAHKEEHRLALAAPLGDLLALAVLGQVEAREARSREVWLVPVPSRPAVVRRRGHDPLLRVARRAACTLRRDGLEARVWSALRGVRAVEDQAGLGASERAVNLRGSMRCRRISSRVAGDTPRQALVVVVDDVLTTGATLREAQRALEACEVVVRGHATVAATQRRASARGG